VRPSWVEVDLRAIAHNVETLAAIAAPTRLCTVVKADAYGHGDVPVAVAALAHGATWLAVALVEEGIRLREAGIEAPILLLSEPPPEDAADVIRWRLTPSVYRHVFLEALATEAEAGETPVSVHLKLDTGMHRAGGSRDDVLSLARRIAAGGLPITIGGLWTHFAVAEEDADYTALQAGRLDGVVETLRAEGVDPGIVHLANTAGTLLAPDARRDLVRVGLGTYGLHPSGATGELADLRPAMRVVSHVSLVRRLPAGSRPSYGRRRPLAAESTVATVPIGYADGVPRLLSSQGGEVLIGGRRHPLAGTVTMDQIVVDVGDAEVRVGDEVVLIGRQGDEEIGADEWAERTGTISYEIVCGMGPRLPRRYLEEDE
jgi:alanine racemase